jgi:hypothetical protein
VYSLTRTPHDLCRWNVFPNQCDWHKAHLLELPFRYNLGCAAADFAGFSVGSIALITRGTCTFADKIANAAAAGAVAALISNNSPGGAIEVTAVNPTLIPALFTTMGIGDEFRSLLTETGVIARVGVPVPGPIAGAGLPGLILACGGLVALARRRKKLIQSMA